ncbi:glycerophosphodiester phosphodiesterase family protein [Thermococcus stetteri]|uniref:glycerophosphodiester phosphodiesterase family protein n=1 Tax=Thermococcus stetteri TaxID=49900 RepID=UPI001AE30012|nr:glycerophosphodiester phosphodiesterase family protein [Thermococcus stetteri]MBP1912017.1 glycerophosphoryl diester phosphodiesterase [Thermococcus stetteri]
MRVLTLGHRGFRGRLENTIPAFRRALRWADGVEMDVRLTGDGRLVAHHDRGFRSDGEYHLLSELTLPELKRLHPLGGLVPEVRKVLSEIQGFFDFDVKEADAVGKLVDLVERKSLVGSCVFSSDSPEIVRKLVSECPDCRVGFSITSYRSVLELSRVSGLYSIHVPIDGVSYVGYGAFTTLLRTLRKRGLKIYLWNYRMDELLWVPRLLPFVDAVISDDPLKLRKALIREEPGC